MILVKPKHEILTMVDGDEVVERIERAGRTCYKSEDKITLGSANKFVKRILKSGHDSVIEHENISVRFICDRGVTHEIVRHRLAAYSQESTRYCNYKGGITFVIPPWTEWQSGDYTPSLIKEINNTPQSIYREDLLVGDLCWLNSMHAAEISYITLLNADQSPQQARSVLPNSLKTEIIMTANIREWRHILKLRCSKAAHPQMRELMIPLLKEFWGKMPILFDDIYLFK